MFAKVMSIILKMLSLASLIPIYIRDYLLQERAVLQRQREFPERRERRGPGRRNAEGPQRRRVELQVRALERARQREARDGRQRAAADVEGQRGLNALRGFQTGFQWCQSAQLF